MCAHVHEYLLSQSIEQPISCRKHMVGRLFSSPRLLARLENLAKPVLDHLIQEFCELSSRKQQRIMSYSSRHNYSETNGSARVCDLHLLVIPQTSGRTSKVYLFAIIVDVQGILDLPFVLGHFP